jgi:hypothetical protein
VRYDGDGSSDVVQGGMGDMADVSAEGIGADTAADDGQGGIAGGVDEHLRGTAAPARLDHLDARELPPPGTQHLGQGGGMLALERVVEFGVAGKR